jgi:hypothetical protein
MNKLIIYSETIFSDRISKEIVRYATKDTVDVIYSDEVRKNDLFLRRKNTSWFYKSRVKLVRGLFFLMRFVAPLKANRQALKDHFLLDCSHYGFGRENVLKAFIWLASKYKFLRSLILKMSLLLVPKDVVKNIFDQDSHLNVLVFSFANLKSLSVLSLVANARKTKQHKIFSIVQSWDNPTTKGYGLFRPDYTLTWTELMRKELLEYQDIPLYTSSPIGSPTFSRKYSSTLKKLDAKKIEKKIIFATKSPASFGNNVDIAIFLALYSAAKNVDLEVRVHPLSLLRKSTELEDLKNLSERFCFSLHYAELEDGLPNLDVDRDNLAHTSNPGDILVTVYSTMNLEAANLGLDCINVDFEINGSEIKPQRMSMSIDRRQPHNQRLLRYGYIRNVSSLGELAAALDGALQSDDQERIQSAIQSVVDNECLPTFLVSELIEQINRYRGSES